MYLAPALALVVSGMLHGTDADATPTYGSYTQAYQQAAEVDRPMLVILNPPADQVSTEAAISVEELRRDTEIEGLLKNYVVAEIDTGTEHGRKVHELFGSKPLPRVVVIDSHQKLQIYRTSEHLERTRLKEVLETYQTGKSISTSTLQSTLQSTQQFTPGYCPNCRRF